MAYDEVIHLKKVGGGGGGGTWGSITGTLSDQTDLQTALNSKWNTTGNAGTTADTNFLGTTDDIDVVFKQNSVEALRLLSGQNIGINTTTAGSVASATSSSTVAQRLAKLTILGSDISVVGITVGRGGGQKTSNSVLGFQSLFNNTSGTNATAMGYQAMYSSTTSFANTAIGHSALYTATTSNSNTAIGETALYSTTTGSGSNTAIGRASLYSNTTGSSNVAIGFQTMYYNSTGSFNLAIGTQSLFNSTASNNTAFGYSAGTNNTSGTYNLYLGRSAGGGITTGSYNTIVGTIGGLSATLANHVIVGDGQGNMRFVSFNDGNIYLGAGTSLPTNAGYKLDINGTGIFRGKLTVQNTNYAEINIKSTNIDPILRFTDANGDTATINTTYAFNPSLGSNHMSQALNIFVNANAGAGYYNASPKINNIIYKGLWGNTYPSQSDGGWFVYFANTVAGTLTTDKAIRVTPDKRTFFYNKISDILVGETDAASLYAADITAGNSALHTRTENGDIIKLYKEAAVTTVQGLADALANQGLIASSTIAGGSSSKETRITIPGQQIADTSNYQGLFRKNTTGSTVTISNVAVCVAKAAAGSGAACSVNVYKSSGTAADGINTSATALFSSAIALGTGNDSLTNTPTTTTVENGRWVSLRVTSSAGATNFASDLQCIITYS